LIDRAPATCGGRPKVAGAGLTVARIAGWRKMSVTPEEISLACPRLTLAQVHAALAYYRIDRDEREADLNRESSILISMAARARAPTLYAGREGVSLILAQRGNLVQNDSVCFRLEGAREMPLRAEHLF